MQSRVNVGNARGYPPAPCRRREAGEMRSNQERLRMWFVTGACGLALAVRLFSVRRIAVDFGTWSHRLGRQFASGARGM